MAKEIDDFIINNFVHPEDIDYWCISWPPPDSTEMTANPLKSVNFAVASACTAVSHNPIIILNYGWYLHRSTAGGRKNENTILWKSMKKTIKNRPWKSIKTLWWTIATWLFFLIKALNIDLILLTRSKIIANSWLTLLCQYYLNSRRCDRKIMLTLESFILFCRTLIWKLYTINICYTDFILEITNFNGKVSKAKHLYGANKFCHVLHEHKRKTKKIKRNQFSSFLWTEYDKFYATWYILNTSIIIL